MSRKEELRNRIDARMKQLRADLAAAKADAQGKSNDQVEKIEAKLQEANKVLKNGWENVSEDIAARLNKLLN